MSESDGTGWLVAFVIFSVAQWGSFFDDNKKAVYGEASRLPVNCRAYVQVSVDGFRRGDFDASSVMNGLERNCGVNGQAWKDSR